MRIALNQKGSALGDFGAPRFAFDQTGTRFAGLCYQSTKARKCPRYYFVGRTADHSHDDPHGTDLADHHAARAYAYRIVQELREGGYHPPGATMAVRD